MELHKKKRECFSILTSNARLARQRWTLDNIIRANGIDWDQPRSILDAPSQQCEDTLLRHRLFADRRVQLVTLAVRHAVPAIYPWPTDAAAVRVFVTRESVI
jgi:hypothetical protein